MCLTSVNVILLKRTFAQYIKFAGDAILLIASLPESQFDSNVLLAADADYGYSLTNFSADLPEYKFWLEFL